jgi:hypothetical protein
MEHFINSTKMLLLLKQSVFLIHHYKTKHSQVYNKLYTDNYYTPHTTGIIHNFNENKS